MGTRIRYVKTENDAIFKSMQVYTNGIRAMYAVLDKTNMRYRVHDASDHSVLVEGGDTKNFAVLKRQAKRCLETLGIVFADESRIRNLK